MISKLIFSFISAIIGCLIGHNLYPVLDDIGWADALYVYLSEAEKGNAEAQYYAGNYILQGKGHEQDAEKGEEWIHKSAGNGYTKAQVELAERYQKGDNIYGIPLNKQKALHFYKLAIETIKKHIQQLEKEK